MKNALLCSIATASILYSGAAFAQAQNQNQPQQMQQADACERLAVFIDENQGRDLGVDENELMVLIRDGDAEACEQQLVQLDPEYRTTVQAQTDTEGRIVVEQDAPDIRIDQAEPRIIVRQAQPDVAVMQPQPEIIVRQPAPQVTVNIPQPEIVVRMAQPEVRVSQAQPQVQVQQSQPQVEVVQQEQQAQVMMQQREQAQVQILESEEEANVQIQRGAQPNVRYEAEEPEVTIMRAEGQPQVRYEQMAEGQQQTRTEQRQQQAEIRTQQGFETAEQGQVEVERRAVETEQAIVGEREMTGAVGGQMITAEEMTGMDVVNARGNQLGDIESLAVSTQDNRTMAIIAHGGFLGLGEKRVAIPLDELTMVGDDQLLVRGLTDDQIRAMPEWQENDPNYQILRGTERTEITVQ